MNFKEVAGEIILRANDEKWYETEERIVEALKAAFKEGAAEGLRSGLNPEGALEARGSIPPPSSINQADGMEFVPECCPHPEDRHYYPSATVRACFECHCS